MAVQGGTRFRAGRARPDWVAISIRAGRAAHRKLADHRSRESAGLGLLRGVVVKLADSRGRQNAWSTLRFLIMRQKMHKKTGRKGRKRRSVVRRMQGCVIEKHRWSWWRAFANLALVWQQPGARQPRRRLCTRRHPLRGIPWRQSLASRTGDFTLPTCDKRWHMDRCVRHRARWKGFLSPGFSFSVTPPKRYAQRRQNCAPCRQRPCRPRWGLYISKARAATSQAGF